MTDIYVVVKTGCEGIDKLCYATTDPKEALNAIEKLRKNILEEKEQRKKEDMEFGYAKEERRQLDERFYDFRYDPDFYCIQKWDGKKFTCCCAELGCKPSKLMLR